MKATPKLDRRMRTLFHILGLSCLGGAIFLQILVFADILQHGYFMAIEKNPAILFIEIALTAFAFIYFIYIYQRFVRSLR
jgi:Na+/proline symporter